MVGYVGRFPLTLTLGERDKETSQPAQKSGPSALSRVTRRRPRPRLPRRRRRARAAGARRRGSRPRASTSVMRATGGRLETEGAELHGSLPAGRAIVAQAWVDSPPLPRAPLRRRRGAVDDGALVGE